MMMRGEGEIAWKHLGSLYIMRGKDKRKRVKWTLLSTITGRDRLWKSYVGFKSYRDSSECGFLDFRGGKFCTAICKMGDSNPTDSSARVNGTSRFDPNFTQIVIDAMGPKTSPRMRQLMTSLIRHVHDFARENELTVNEWMEGVKLINWAGQMSNDRRNEGQLVCDVIGLES
jgi:Catechol dioxygenase N terminus